ncbi:hypothetical protein HDU97_006953 [Phlyctochytrium planicorne]|nr:hypothetical protein HDU97_006953 [Phlyctochytrium planicorne]
MQTYRDFHKEALRLKDFYKGKIELIVGMETEHIHQRSLSEVKDLRSQFNLEFLVGSVHHVLGHPIDYDEIMYSDCEAASAAKHPYVSPTEAAFLEYFDAQLDLLESIKPEVIGHFDLIRMFRPNHPLSQAVLSKIERNIDFIAGYGGLVEVNSRAFKKGLKDPYPQRDVLEIMLRKGVKFTLSDDSHGPEDVGMYYKGLLGYLNEMGISSVYRLGHDLGSGRIVVVEMEGIVSHDSWANMA